MNIEDYYLDLDKVSSLRTEEEKQQIHVYYRDVINASAERKNNEVQTLMNTLIEGGYLRQLIQEEKIEKILG